LPIHTAHELETFTSCQSSFSVPLFRNLFRNVPRSGTAQSIDSKKKNTIVPRFVPLFRSFERGSLKKHLLSNRQGAATEKPNPPIPPITLKLRNSGTTLFFITYYLSIYLILFNTISQPKSPHPITFQ